jgi:hypothetical protein
MPKGPRGEKRPGACKKRGWAHHKALGVCISALRHPPRRVKFDKTVRDGSVKLACASLKLRDEPAVHMPHQ